MIYQRMSEIEAENRSSEQESNNKQEQQSKKSESSDQRNSQDHNTSNAKGMDKLLNKVPNMSPEGPLGTQTKGIFSPFQLHSITPTYTCIRAPLRNRRPPRPSPQLLTQTSGPRNRRDRQPTWRSSGTRPTCSPTRGNRRWRAQISA